MTVTETPSLRELEEINAELRLQVVEAERQRDDALNRAARALVVDPADPAVIDRVTAADLAHDRLDWPFSDYYGHRCSCRATFPTGAELQAHRTAALLAALGGGQR